MLVTPYRQDHKPAASGMLLPNIEARIIDDKGEDVPEGHPGELLVRCAHYSIIASSVLDVPCPIPCSGPNLMK